MKYVRYHTKFINLSIYNKSYNLIIIDDISIQKRYNVLRLKIVETNMIKWKIAALTISILIASSS